MPSHTPLAHLPGSRPGQRLRVSLAQARDGAVSIELCEQHHADGIGWFDQRTLALEPGQFKRLQALLAMAPSETDGPTVDPDEAPATLPFPGPFERPARRRVGDAL